MIDYTQDIAPLQTAAKQNEPSQDVISQDWRLHGLKQQCNLPMHAWGGSRLVSRCLGLIYRICRDGQVDCCDPPWLEKLNSINSSKQKKNLTFLEGCQKLHIIISSLASFSQGSHSQIQRDSTHATTPPGLRPWCDPKI